MTTRRQRRAATRATQAAGAQRAARPGAWLMIAFALAVVTMLAYQPALHAPFVIDDASTIDASSRWTSVSGSPTAGRPLVTATLALNYDLNRAVNLDQRPDPDGPDKAVGYRLFNIFVHLLAGVLLFGVVRRAMRENPIPESWRAIADPVAGIVTALWLLHPIQSETVNYIVQRSESLASLFYLATLYASQRAWTVAKAERVRWYVLAGAACALGMLSKEIVISAPLAVMLYDRAFRLPSWRAMLKPGEARGWFYVALWSVCIASFVLFALGARGASAGFSNGVTWYAYLYTQCWAIAHYLRLVAWPNALSIDYGYQTIRGARGIPGAFLLCVFAAATLAAWIRVERYGWFAFLGSMFFMLLAPSSSVVPVVLEVAAERRIYLALAAVLIPAVIGAEALRRKLAPRLSPRWLAIGGGAIAAALAFSTAARSRVYADPEELWRSTVAATPGNSRALGQLGETLFKQQPPRLAEAETAFVAALAEDSACPGKCFEYAALLSNEGRFREAVPMLDRHLAWDTGNLLAERLLAYDLMKLGDYARAIPYLEHVVSQRQTESEFVMLGVAYLSAGRHDEAVATFRRMAGVAPNNAQLQRLSQRLQDGTNVPGALANLQDFAFGLARGWM